LKAKLNLQERYGVSQGTDGSGVRTWESWEVLGSPAAPALLLATAAEDRHTHEGKRLKSRQEALI